MPWLSCYVCNHNSIINIYAFFSLCLVPTDPPPPWRHSTNYYRHASTKLSFPSRKTKKDSVSPQPAPICLEFAWVQLCVMNWNASSSHFFSIPFTLHPFLLWLCTHCIFTQFFFLSSMYNSILYSTMFSIVATWQGVVDEMKLCRTLVYKTSFWYETAVWTAPFFQVPSKKKVELVNKHARNCLAVLYTHHKFVFETSWFNYTSY